ncbi:MAG: beta strand repeat-containing protein, partial [Dolichospermum sp.]
PSQGCTSGTIATNTSQSGVNYQLYNGSNSIFGTSQAGTGSSLTWSGVTFGNGYYVIATNASTNCTSTSSTVYVTSNAATALVLTGSTICASPGNNGTITSTTSISNVSYQLWQNGSTVQSSITGTGSGLTWSGLSIANNYTVIATNSGGCTATSNSVNVSSFTNPSSAVLSGNNSICSGSTTNLQVAITGGASPFTVVYNNGSNQTINNYTSGSNISVSPTTNTTYTLTSVTDANGCVSSGLSGTPTVSMLATGTWTGLTNTDANSSGNWCGGVPNNINVVIPSGLSNYPVLSGDLAVNNLNISSGATFGLGTKKLTIAGTISGAGNLIGNNSSSLEISGTGGTINFSQAVDGNHLLADASTSTNSLGNLTLNGTSTTLTLGNKVNLYGTLTTATGTTLDTDDGFLVFRNTATTTARVADLTVGAGTISGTVRSEMWMHSGRRAWRFITNPTPISGGTIANNWQSNFGHASGYGTNIYGPSGGTGLNSPATPSASMMKFNSTLNTTGGYDNITNTNNDLDGTYFIFVRGDKSVIAVPNGTSPWVQTTLASKGNIKTGTQTISLNGLNGRYGA